MKILSWIAGLGLSLGIVFLGLAFSTAGMSRDFSGRAPLSQGEDHKEWAWDGGERVRIAVPATVHYQAGGSPRVIVRGPADLLNRVRFQDGDLEMENDWFGGSHGERLDVTLAGMTLRDIGLSGSARMDMGEIRQDDLNISISGSGRFNASGSADNLSLHVSGSGTCDVGALAARTVRADISGSGKIEAASPRSAEVSISGSGQMHFAAMPKEISSHISGSGRISDAAGQVITRRYHRERG